MQLKRFLFIKSSSRILPKLQEIFKNVQIYGDEKTRKIIDCLEATEKVMLQNMMIIFVI